MEPGACRPRRKCARYKLPIDLANACGETATLGGKESGVDVESSEDAKLPRRRVEKSHHQQQMINQLSHQARRN